MCKGSQGHHSFEASCTAGAVSGFSGQKLYNDILYQGYNDAWLKGSRNCFCALVQLVSKSPSPDAMLQLSGDCSRSGNCEQSHMHASVHAHGLDTLACARGRPGVCVLCSHPRMHVDAHTHVHFCFQARGTHLVRAQAPQ